MESWKKFLCSIFVVGEVIGITIFVSAKDFNTAQAGWMIGLFSLLIPVVFSIFYI